MTPLPTVQGGFRCVVSDVPGQFRDRNTRGAAERHYRTMSTAELCALPVREIVAPDALLLYWTTSAHLLDCSAQEVVGAWGFTGKTTIAWVKRKPPKVPAALRREMEDAICAGVANSILLDWIARVEAELAAPRLQIGLGHYTRGAHELVIVARRGKARVLRHDIPSVIFAPRGKHSAKPEQLQDVAEQLIGGPRIELFARRARPGWVTWGDQAPIPEAA